MKIPIDSSKSWRSYDHDAVVDSTGDLKFTDFCLKPKLLRNLNEMGWRQPSPIQQETIPLAVSGLNVVARAKSGTGKTGAFLIPLLQRVNQRRKRIQALILVPSHELAMQTSRECIRMSAKMHMKTMFTSEGSNLKDDILCCLHKVHIVVGTPARVLDLIRTKVCDLQTLRLVVLDETDALLGAAIKVNTEKVLCLLPRRVQYLLFSANYSNAVKSLVDKFVRSPRAVNLINDTCDPLLGNVTQFYVHTEESDKLNVLREIYRNLRVHQMLIICRPETQRCETLAKLLTVMGVQCYYWHPAMLVQHRNRVMHEFREGMCRNLVCTDALVRGLDVPAVNVVVNFDMAPRMDTYMQRMGRTGRYGRVGLLINLVAASELHKIALLEKSLNTVIHPLADCMCKTYQKVLVKPVNQYVCLVRFWIDDKQPEEMMEEERSGKSEIVGDKLNDMKRYMKR